MNKNSRKLGLYIAASLVFAAAASTFRTIALLMDLEDNLIYFAKNPLLPTANILVIAAVALALHTACHEGRLCGMEAADGSAGDAHKHHGEDGR